MMYSESQVKEMLLSIATVSRNETKRVIEYLQPRKPKSQVIDAVDSVYRAIDAEVEVQMKMSGFQSNNHQILK